MNYKTLITGVIISSILMICLFFLFESKKDKIMYVKLGKVYEEFQMKKDLENKYKGVQDSRKSILDSMELELGFIYKRLENTHNPSKNEVEEYEFKKEKYFLKKEQFNEDNKAVVEQYSAQIMKKINEYIVLYGKEKGYSFILGADGNGTIMYAEEYRDVTDDVLKFINATYNGNPK